MMSSNINAHDNQHIPREREKERKKERKREREKEREQKKKISCLMVRSGSTILDDRIIEEGTYRYLVRFVRWSQVEDYWIQGNKFERASIAERI
jgi:hypothetical protein